MHCIHAGNSTISPGTTVSASTAENDWICNLSEDETINQKGGITDLNGPLGAISIHVCLCECARGSVCVHGGVSVSTVCKGDSRPGIWAREGYCAFQHDGAAEMSVRVRNPILIHVARRHHSPVQERHWRGSDQPGRNYDVHTADNRVSDTIVMKCIRTVACGRSALITTLNKRSHFSTPPDTIAPRSAKPSEARPLTLRAKPLVLRPRERRQAPHHPEGGPWQQVLARGRPIGWRVPSLEDRDLAGRHTHVHEGWAYHECI